jgi:hypothetical protein
MATVPFPGSWSTAAQFTGNAAYCFDSHGVLWLAAATTSSGFVLFSSEDMGATFSEDASDTAGQGSISFDPAIAVDSSGLLHIIGQAQVDSLILLVAYTYDPVANHLTGPSPLTIGGMVGADYDIVCLSDGTSFIVASLLTGSRETLPAFRVNNAGSILSTDTLVPPQATLQGNRYGSISLWSPDGASVEIYLCYDPKDFTFQDAASSIVMMTLSASGTYSPAVPLTSFQARYTTDRLTVTGTDAGNTHVRYLSQGYFTQKGASLVGNVILGYQPYAGASWRFYTANGTPASSYVQPCLVKSATSLVLGVLQVANGTTGDGAPVRLFDVNPASWSVLPRTDFTYPSTVNWLRGTKSILPVGMPWGFFAQNKAANARFYTGYMPPPVAIVTPASEQCQRNRTYQFSAASSYDLNAHALRYTWSLNDPTGAATLFSNGPNAYVTLPNSVGPAEQVLTLTVSVVDVDVNGAPYHTAVTAAATLTYPDIAAPAIAAPVLIHAARNSQATITPSVTVSPYVTPVYDWVQTGGTVVRMLTPPNVPGLTISTAGALVSGETLTFTLAVADGVNVPVLQAFQVAVAARSSIPLNTVYGRAPWYGTIGQRNTWNPTGAWGQYQQSSIPTQFFGAKRSPLPNLLEGWTPGSTNLGEQEGVYLLIGQYGVLVQRLDATYNAFPPNPLDTVLDAEHSYLDYTILLTASQLLVQVLPNVTGSDSDCAGAVINLTNYCSTPLTTVTATPPFAGKRIIVLTSTAGVLLLQVDGGFRVLGSLLINHGIEGAINVQWVRLSDVESLRSGKLLIGTEDALGGFYETEYSLVTRSAIGVWDHTMLKNQTVSTGEMLFESTDPYSGVPVAPVLAPPAIVGGLVHLNWTQPRQDLLTGYRITVTGGLTPTPAINVNAGTISQLTVNNLFAGNVYDFSIVALSVDGTSLPSNIVTIQL